MVYYKFVKYFFDIIFGILFFPILIVITVLLSPIVYLTDKGPIFYLSKRIGLRGRPFTMYKFRTMKVDAPDIRLSDGSTYNSKDDPRITKFGKFLRNTSIDELPQIINVIKGDMSIVGPRPDPLDWLNKYKEEEKNFLNVKPGITGYNQAYFRNTADSKLKILNDNYYAHYISFFFDFKIIFKSIITVLLQKNINIEKSRNFLND